MRKGIAGATLAAIGLLSGCAPYLYQTEIDGFSKGVNDLGSAYASALSSTASERQERQRWQWGRAGAELALTEGCVPNAPGQPLITSECRLREVGKTPPPPSPVEAAAAGAAPIVKALRKYVDALAAVTNAADRQALEAAVVQFQGSVQGLVNQVQPGGPQLGPIADVIGAAGIAALDTRRYWALREGVNDANGAVATLGNALGVALDSLKTARANELRSTADLLVEELKPGVESTAYVTRVGLLESRTDAIDALRRSDPREAAREMVEAHEQLARALRDDKRQVTAVTTSIQTFVDKAKAVRDAFGA